MKFRRAITPLTLVFVICLACIVPGQAGQPRKKAAKSAVKGPPKVTLKTMRGKISHILNDPALESSFTGIEVMDLVTGKVIYDRNADKLFHPASNTKVITTAAALNLIPNHIYRTSVGTDGTIHDTTLTGNLFIRGSGDPVLRTEHLDSLALTLFGRGIRVITGDLVGDASYFDTVSWGSGWMWDDEPSSDEPFITPLAVNGNAVRVIVEPGKRAGTKPLYTLVPPTTRLRLINSAMTGIDTISTPLLVTRPRGENEIRIEGLIAPRAPEKHFDISVWKPEQFFLELFRDRLQEHGIVVEGTNRLAPYRGDSLLAEIIHPLDSAIILINKQSDNLGAESLIKTMGAELNGRPGSWGNGLPAVRRYLAGIGIDTTGIILNDGSGVSFYNVFTPANMVTILSSLHTKPELFRRMYQSLPIAGIDGTLRNRMLHTKAAGKVHAKTGTITGVSALSGYVSDPNGKLMAFSIMSNHFPGEVKVLRSIQDAILELLAGNIVMY